MALPASPSALVVDDDNFFRQAVGQALEAEGFRCRTAKDGEEGFALYKRTLPDVVVLDRIMPQTGGTRFMMKVKEDPNRRRALLIVYSSTFRAASDTGPLDEESGKGFSRVLEVPKTTGPVELAAVVRGILAGGPSLA